MTGANNWALTLQESGLLRIREDLGEDGEFQQYVAPGYYYYHIRAYIDGNFRNIGQSPIGYSDTNKRFLEWMPKDKIYA